MLPAKLCIQADCLISTRFIAYGRPFRISIINLASNLRSSNQFFVKQLASHAYPPFDWSIIDHAPTDGSLEFFGE
jgi:hypothetical protein